MPMISLTFSALKSVGLRQHLIRKWWWRTRDAARRRLCEPAYEHAERVATWLGSHILTYYL